MTDSLMIREAELVDAAAIGDLLRQNDRSLNEVLLPKTRYWLAENASRSVIGVVGLEFGFQATLFQHVAVLSAWRGQGVGCKLTTQALKAANSVGCNQVSLFSTDARAYWRRFGYHKVEGSELIAALPEAPQVPEYTGLGL